MNQESLAGYARLLLKTGVNLQPGQKLDIGWEMAHRPFVEVLVDEAYRLGAAYVNLRLNTPQFVRARVEHSAPQHLDFVPGWMTGYWDELVKDDWAVISLTGPENPEALEGVDPSLTGRLQAALGSRREAYFEALTKSFFCWNVAAVPTDGWARQVLGPEARADDLWQVLTPILDLDTVDCAERWAVRIQALNRRCRRLQDAALTSIHFEGPGTDLTVGLMSKSRWRGGDEVTPRGRRFAPNLPTEEVFTTPDWRLTEGTVVCTRPVEVMGASVEGARFVFRQGRVVEASASKNQALLERYLGQDSQSNALGEVALVDGSSRIFQSGRIFHNILFDENAACHIALGSGYPDAVEGGREASSDELLSWGCNVSRVHTDFMIGGPEVSVVGRTVDGKILPLLDHGKFVSGL